TGEMPVARFEEVDACLRSLHSELDHRYINQEVAGLKDRPITTESLAGYIYQHVSVNLQLHRVRLHERADFFSEVWNDKTVFLGMQMPFNAAHRLHAAALSDAENAKLYGKCNSLHGHGHRYLTETTIGGEYDSRSGTLRDLAAFKNAIEDSLRPWQDRHLDLGILAPAVEVAAPLRRSWLRGTSHCFSTVATRLPWRKYVRGLSRAVHMLFN